MSTESPRFLIGSSLTAASDEVVRAGAALARAAGAKVHLFHAFAPAAAYGGVPLEKERTVLRSKLAQQARAMNLREEELAGLTVEVGSPHRALLAAARDLGFELIIVGSSETPRLAKLFGSTAERIVRRSEHPVLVVRGEMKVPPRRVLLPVDLSLLSAETFRQGLAFLDRFAPGGTAIEALFVLTETELRALAANEGGDLDDAKRWSQQDLQRFVESTGAGNGRSVCVRMGVGPVEPSILTRIDNWRPGLVILGTHRSGFKRYLSGSVAAQLVRSARTSILVLPPRQANMGRRYVAASETASLRPPAQQRRQSNVFALPPVSESGRDFMVFRRIRHLPLPLLALVLSLALWTGTALPAAAGQGRWTPVGPAMGRPMQLIGSVVPDPVESGAVWAGLPLGSLYRSSDHGATWHWAGRPFTGDGLRAVAADPTAAGALWIARPDGLFHTADQGVHWSLVSGASYIDALRGEPALKLSAVPGSPVSFFVQTQRRVLASADGGQSWRTVFDSGDEALVFQHAVVAGAPATLYVGTVGSAGWGLWVSVDGGRSWTPLTSCPALATGFERIAVSADAVYVLPVEEERLGLLRSRDAGRTWQSVLGNRPGRPFVLLDVVVDPGAPRTIWAVGGPRGASQDDVTLWVSRDGGGVWRRRALPPLQARLAPGPDALYAYDAEQLVRSLDDGWTWSRVLALPQDEGPPSRLGFGQEDPARMTFVIGHHIFDSADGGRSWHLIWGPRGSNDIWRDPVHPGRMVAVGALGLSISSDGGRSWGASQLSDLYAEFLVSAGGRTLFAGGCGVYRSRNGGKSWQEVLPCVSRRDPAARGRFVQKLEVDPAHPQIVYALTFQDRDFYPNHGPMTGLPSLLWRSRDGGATWRQIANELDAFTLDRNRSRLYASRGSDLFASDDGGDTWSALPQMPDRVTDLATPGGMPDTLYAADSPALRRSRDGGRTWETFDQGIPPGDYLLTVHPVDGRTVYARSRDGLFHLALPAPAP